jgi:hypothetical protein
MTFGAPEVLLVLALVLAAIGLFMWLQRGERRRK